ncbi:hypothetical protein HYV86_04075 [Candidatus Woesearchaeota archaeon]|nr:hypothetical protein [Candidatus Woesearchaeota archaeon]
MDLERRLQTIAQMENIPVEDFDIRGAQKFLNQYVYYNPIVEIHLEYESRQLSAVSVGIASPEISDSYEVY